MNIKYKLKKLFGILDISEPVYTIGEMMQDVELWHNAVCSKTTIDGDWICVELDSKRINYEFKYVDIYSVYLTNEEYCYLLSLQAKLKKQLKEKDEIKNRDRMINDIKGMKWN